jgi:alanine racemase
MIEIPSPLRLRLSTEALMSNWRWLAAQGDAAICGAAVKANAYGLGSVEVVQHLSRAGCCHFFVATWAEAAALEPLLAGGELSVLHGLGADDCAAAAALSARPVLGSAEQIQRWRHMGADRPCDVMVDTGMNRLGVRVDEVLAGVTDGLNIVNCLSHLSCADEDDAVSAAQLAAFRMAKAHVKAQRFSLANSAGICLGADYHFDLMRPGVSLYGGVVHPLMRGNIRQVVTPEARVLQVRSVPMGEAVGYGGIWRAERESRVAVINLGYADGYLRCHSGQGIGQWNDHIVPSIGRVSMDLLAFDVTDCEDVAEGDWISLSYNLEHTASRCGLSQYELLTTLGARFERLWE